MALKEYIDQHIQMRLGSGWQRIFFTREFETCVEKLAGGRRKTAGKLSDLERPVGDLPDGLEPGQY